LGFRNTHDHRLRDVVLSVEVRTYSSYGACYLLPKFRGLSLLIWVQNHMFSEKRNEGRVGHASSLIVGRTAGRVRGRERLNVYYDEDADLSVLKNDIVAIVGYGNQGQAQALNMRDSGVNVIVGNVKDSYYDQAAKDGFKAYSIGEAAKQATIICMIIPDEVQKGVYETEIQQHLSKGKMLVFSSGYNIHFGFIAPPKDVDVIDMFPLTFGARVRERFLNRQSLGSFLAIGQDATGKAKQKALALAKAIGCTRGGTFETTFAHETEINLYLEQVVYPAIFRIMALSFDVLVDAGYPPELVSLEMYLSKEPSEFFASMAELGFFESAKVGSTTAQYGEMTRAPRIIKDDIKNIMKEHLREIQTGVFANEWALEQAAGYPVFNKLRKEGLEHPMNEVEKRVKKLIRPQEAQSKIQSG